MRLKDCPKNVVLIDNDDGMKIKILSNYGSEKLKIQTIDLGKNFWLYSRLKVGKISVVENDYIGNCQWQVFKEEESMNKFDNKSVQKLKDDINQMKKNIESAEKTLKEMKQKKIPNLILGEMYKSSENHSTLAVCKFIVCDFCVDDRVKVLFIEANDETYFDLKYNVISELNDGTLIHLKDPENKAVAKFFYNHYKNGTLNI